MRETRYGSVFHESVVFIKKLIIISTGYLELLYDTFEWFINFSKISFKPKINEFDGDNEKLKKTEQIEIWILNKLLRMFHQIWLIRDCVHNTNNIINSLESYEIS